MATGSVVCLVAAAALTVTALAAPPAEAAAGPERASCGVYQCFNTAAAVLRSVPDPAAGQVATVPLAKRAIGPARGSPRMLIGLDNGDRAYWSLSDGLAQGVSGSVGGASAGNVLNFDHWPYVDELYYYAHNVFSIPPTQWVNAAHRNGVPVLGVVTGDCDRCGPQAQTLLNPHNYLRAVRKLYAYAVAYGFDGWVIDFERGFKPNANTPRVIKQLAAKKLPDGQPLRVAVYQAQNYNLGCVPRQDARCRDLLPSFRAGAAWQADYIKAPGYPRQTYQALAKAGLAARRLDAYWATYVYGTEEENYFNKPCAGIRTTASQIWNGNGRKECLNTAAMFRNQRTIVGPGERSGPRYYTSAALFAPEWTYFGGLSGPGPGGRLAGPTSRPLVHAADDALWVGANVRYSGHNCARSGTGNAVSSYITPRSVVNRLPFVTSFDEGEGDIYTVEGERAANVPWNDLSAQDVLPTWVCSLSGQLKAVPVYGNAADSDAFNGGSALSVTGPGAGEVALYRTRIPVPARSRLTVAFEARTSSGPLPFIRLYFSDGTTATVKSARAAPGWNRTISSVKGAQRKTITRISVGFAGRRPIHSVLGELRIYDASTDRQPSAITITATGRSISWTGPARPRIAYWNVYTNEGNCLQLLGPAFTTTYDVTQRMFGSVKPTSQFVVQPVSATGSAARVGPICPTGS